jgi:hypothetical protein
MYRIARFLDYYCRLGVLVQQCISPVTKNPVGSRACNRRPMSLIICISGHTRGGNYAHYNTANLQSLIIARRAQNKTLGGLILATDITISETSHTLGLAILVRIPLG